MAEHTRADQNKHEDVDQKHRVNQKESQPLFEQVHAWEQGAFPITETPFQPRMDEHAELLAATRADEARSNLLIHLQQTYGNKYVQRLTESIAVQPKLTVNPPNDVYEQEADRVAEVVTGSIGSQVQRQEEEEEEELIQGKLQRAATNTVPEVDPETENRINATRGGGRPLDDGILSPMEQAFGADFSQVRVHTDASADNLNQSLQARAFTTGQDIFFKNGEYNPASSAGKQLLAHELTHTIQQTGEGELKQTASRTMVKTPPPIPKSKPWKKEPPPVPSKAGRPSLPKPGEKYESKPLEGMDPHTYEQAMAQFKQWKKPRLFGGLSKSQRKIEAEKYLGEVVGRAKKYTPHISMIINSVLEAYKNTFSEDLSTIDEMKSLQQAGAGIKSDTAGKNLEEFEKAKEKEQKVGITKETIGTGFSWGGKGSSTTTKMIDIFVPKDKEGNKFSKSKKGKQPMGIAGGATDIFSAFGAGISGIFSIVKTAQLIKKKQGSKAFVSLVNTISGLGGALAKGAKGIVGVVGAAVKAGKGSALDVIKKVLGPIPDAIKTIFGFVKIIYAAAQKKGKEALTATWETVKSGVSAVGNTVSTVFSLIKALGDAVPIVGSIVSGVMAILNGIEAAYWFVKKIWKFISMKRLIDKILEKVKELAAKPAKNEEEQTDKKSKKERLIYIGKNNLKKIKHIGREVLKQGTTFIANGTKLVGAVASLAGEIIAMTGVAAPVGAIFKVFGTMAGIFSTITSAFAAAITFVPKLFHSIRQVGRNVAAKEGGVGKFFRALGFSADKSSAKKEEERKKVIIGIFDDAAELKTDFDDPSGKDREKVEAELPKFKDLEFEIEATGADKKELYKLNEEADDKKRAKGQVKIIYDALKER